MKTIKTETIVKAFVILSIVTMGVCIVIDAFNNGTTL